MNVFDWDKLHEFVAERQPVEVSAGILDDWYWTRDTVYAHGSFIEDHGAFTHSDWGDTGL